MYQHAFEAARRRFARYSTGYSSAFYGITVMSAISSSVCSFLHLHEDDGILGSQAEVKRFGMAMGLVGAALLGFLAIFPLKSNSMDCKAGYVTTSRYLQTKRSIPTNVLDDLYAIRTPFLMHPFLHWRP